MACNCSESAACQEKEKVVGKAEIIVDLANSLQVNKKEAGLILSAVLEAIKEHLRKGENVRLIPFGSFEVRTRKERIGRNPSTREEITIPERRVPVFRPGKDIRDAVK